MTPYSITQWQSLDWGSTYTVLHIKGDFVIDRVECTLGNGKATNNYDGHL